MSLKSFIPRNNAAKVKALTSKPKKTPIDKRRNVVINALDRTLDQIKKKEEAPTRGFYRKAGDGYIATVRAGRSMMEIEGHKQIALEADQLKPFYEAVKKEVSAGNLDAEINKAYESAKAPTKKS